MKVSHLKAKADYQLYVVFDDGVEGLVDLKDYIQKGVFSLLKNTKLFNAVYTTGYSVAWNDELEIDAITIYAELVNKSPADILSENLIHATN
ncbi:DUF2442 domain-containing protein [Mucilaginibacter antarcticus]|uniref:DUF2442 domain-containing protein n=1 Tax=Mucilaginibacter antarcticus TaxID=1855725 RepID=A0ABW5XQJ7_9SPHI